MSVLVIGASHRTAPVELLERLALGRADAGKLALAALETDDVVEALVISTCNRIELYAEAERFHSSVEDLTALLVAEAGLPAREVLPALYVHYDKAAIAHLFSVATGLDSMVVGESQILGQVREALRRGQDEATIGPALNALFQHALRVGKRAHAETGIDATGQSIVSVALETAARDLSSWSGVTVAIVGAGSVAALAATTARRLGASAIVVMSRTAANAARLARSVGGTSLDLSALSDVIARADVLVCCTGATGVLVTSQLVRQARAGADHNRLAIVDLALPHDVEPDVTEIDGVRLVALGDVAGSALGRPDDAEVTAVREIIAAEVAHAAASARATRVAPTVVALRTMASTIVSAELERLWSRTALTQTQRAEITTAMTRVADKLIHEPTVRIKELADRAPASSYADALAELFSLRSSTVEALLLPAEADQARDTPSPSDPRESSQHRGHEDLA